MESALSQVEISREESGVLRESITQSRIMLFGCSAYRSMCDALFEQFQSGAGVILYRMGEGYARKVIEPVTKSHLKGDEAIKTYQRLAYVSGWGNMKLHMLSEDSAECIVEKSAFVLRRPDVGDRSCFFLCGVLGAVATAIIGHRCVAREVSCETAGSQNCKFLVHGEDEGKG